ncbi:MAG TPA: hypothetical protein VIJ87_06845, partial [Pyrinomonadaceae bacterium]
ILRAVQTVSQLGLQSVSYSCDFVDLFSQSGTGDPRNHTRNHTNEIPRQISVLTQSLPWVVLDFDVEARSFSHSHRANAR